MITILFFSLFEVCLAVPAAPDIAELKQPDGTIFAARLIGDEWNNWIETIEGNTNDEGSREGYEVCARKRNFKTKNIDIYRIQ